jgi:glycyl-tRNA synthetase beta chain
MPHLLLEIGTEELPASFVDSALAALPDLTAAKLADARLAHGKVHALGTPRRLAVLVDDVHDRQADLDEEVTGPPEAAAFKDGKPTKAGEAFAAKLGVPLASLAVVDRTASAASGSGKQKPGRYLVGRRIEAGRPAMDLLPRALAEVCPAIPFRKSMRWGAGEVAFGRPVQWIVALFDAAVIDLTFAGVRSGRASRGHRFLAPASFDLAHADAYVAELRARHVLVDGAERKQVMMEKVAAAAWAAGGVYDPEPSLATENASLVEEPHIITGSFDVQFLELPAAVIRAVARGHQKYFCVQKGDGASASIPPRDQEAGSVASSIDAEIVPHYIAVANTANDPARVANGNDRVMRARLADARFFFEEDKKTRPDDLVDKLAGIVFHAKLGTVKEKVLRIQALAQIIAATLGLAAEEQEKVVRAAHLCKFDLVSHMVGEFPELQGHMGRAYARFAGEADAVADAIRDHYRPVGAADSVAPDDVSACVALADRLDTLTGCFAIGLEPTGAADPYALRRACIAILRTLLEKGVNNPRYARLNLKDLVVLAYDDYANTGRKLPGDGAAVAAKVEEFASERLRGLLASASSGAVADAVLASHHEVGGAVTSVTSYPVYALAKAKALAAVVGEKQPWLAKAKTVAKRLSGISKEASPVLHAEGEFTRADDATIVKVVLDCDKMTKELYDELTVRRALAMAEELAQRIDDIFVNTLVNDPSDPKTKERLELLSYGARCMLRIADFSKLS